MRAADRSGQYKLVSVISVTILITVMSWLHGWAAKSTSTSVLALQAEAQVIVVPRTTPTAPQTVAPSAQMTTALPTQTATPSPTPIVLSLLTREYWQRVTKALISTEALAEMVLSLMTVISAWALVSLWPLVRVRFLGDEVKRREDTPQYAKTMQELGSELVHSFEKVDRLIEGIQRYMTDRRKVLDSLEMETEHLKDREIKLKKRIETLEGIPIEALDYFIEATESVERRAARRDYYLFFAGLVGGTILSTIVSPLIKSLGLL